MVWNNILCELFAANASLNQWVDLENLISEWIILLSWFFSINQLIQLVTWIELINSESQMNDLVVTMSLLTVTVWQKYITNICENIFFPQMKKSY